MFLNEVRDILYSHMIVVKYVHQRLIYAVINGQCQC